MHTTLYYVLPACPVVSMLAHCCQEHELEGEGWKVVVQEEHTREEEIGYVMHQPTHYQDTPTRQPVTELGCREEGVKLLP